MNLQSKVCALVLAGASAGAFACTGVEDPNLLVSKLSATSTSINFSERGNPFVATLGTIKNASVACVRNIVVEVKYQDSAGKQVDVVTQTLEDVVVGPGQEVAFRARDVADKPKEAYVTSTVRVISAEPKYTAEPKQKNPLWLDVFVSWAPMLVLIAAYLISMRKFIGKNSPQLQALQRQVTLLERQVEVLDRLAVATEKRVAGNVTEPRS